MKQTGFCRLARYIEVVEAPENIENEAAQITLADAVKNDPPRMAEEGMEGFCTLDYLLTNADIVTLHVPLNETTFCGERLLRCPELGKTDGVPTLQSTEAG